MSGQWSTLIFAIAAGVFLLLQMWRGWRLGIIRALTSLLALALAALAGWLTSQLVMGILGPLLPVAPWVGGLISGALVGGSVYLAATILFAVLFKRTEHQPGGIIRLAFGLGGALVGLATGALLIFAAILVVRGLGTVAEFQTTGENQTAEPLARHMADLKRNLEQGSGGDALRRSDPIPSEIYDLLAKFARVAGDEQAINRLAEHPQVQELMLHPAIVELSLEPGVNTAIEKGNPLLLMTNPAVMKALANKELVESISQLRLEEALDFALETPPDEKKP